MLFPNEGEDDEEKSGMERDGNRSEFSFPCASPAQTRDVLKLIDGRYLTYQVVGLSLFISSTSDNKLSCHWSQQQQRQQHGTAQQTGPFPVSSGTDSRQWRRARQGPVLRPLVSMTPPTRQQHLLLPLLPVLFRSSVTFFLHLIHLTRAENNSVKISTFSRLLSSGSSVVQSPLICGNEHGPVCCLDTETRQ
jgi:hypothetical protein